MKDFWNFVWKEAPRYLLGGAAVFTGAFAAYSFGKEIVERFTKKKNLAGQLVPRKVSVLEGGLNGNPVALVELGDNKRVVPFYGITRNDGGRDFLPEVKSISDYVDNSRIAA